MKRVTKLSISVLVLLNISILYAVGLTLWPHKPFERIDTPFQVEKEAYRRGETVIFNIKGCTGKRQYPFVSSRRIVSEDGSFMQFLFITDGIQPVGCYDYWDRRIIVPYTLPLGRYHIVLSVNFKVSPIKTVNIELPSEPFDVLP